MNSRGLLLIYIIILTPNQQWRKFIKKPTFLKRLIKTLKLIALKPSNSLWIPTSAPGQPYLIYLMQDGVVYVGHLPHGFLEEELKSYFSQYGDVLGVKVARSKKTARSKGYAFIQFRYPEVAQIVSDTMNGYLLLGKVLISHTLPPNERNPFTYASSHKYRFINWQKKFIEQKNKVII